MAGSIWQGTCEWPLVKEGRLDAQLAGLDQTNIAAVAVLPRVRQKVAGVKLATVCKKKQRRAGTV
jgi:hypothetical protein